MNPNYKNCYIDIYLKTKAVTYTCNVVLVVVPCVGSLVAKVNRIIQN